MHDTVPSALTGCSVSGCGRPVHARRRCKRHYSQAWERREFVTTPSPPKLPIPPAPAASPGWMDFAACAEIGPEMFFPEKGEGDVARAAKRVCATCLVTSECLSFAFLIGADFGIFGGLTADERRRLLRRERRAA